MVADFSNVPEKLTVSVFKVMLQTQPPYNAAIIQRGQHKSQTYHKSDLFPTLKLKCKQKINNKKMSICKKHIQSKQK
jgi:hypothetical protein